MYYIGFDLGDGESSLSYYDSEKRLINDEPETILVDGSKSFPTAVATLNENNENIIGYNAISSSAYAKDLRVSFKKLFKLADRDTYDSYRRFIMALMEKLREKNLPFSLDNREEYRFVIGYPADWSRDTVETFESLLDSCGIVSPYLVSESRAALVYFRTCRSVDFPQLGDASSVLVCDFGSSTLDFAYMPDSNTEEVITFGHSNLGGGIIDKQLVVESLALIKDEKERKAAEKLFDTNKHIRSLLLFEARKLKEQYFNTGKSVFREIPVFQKDIGSILISVNDETVRAAISKPLPECGNQSVEYTLNAKFSEAFEMTRRNPPKLVILTGGASRMGFFRSACKLVFAGTEVVFSKTPETDIAYGLALDGNYRKKLADLKHDIEEYRKSGEIEKVVDENIVHLYSKIASALIDELSKNDNLCPGEFRRVFRQWVTEGETINDLCESFKNAFSDYSKSPAFDILINDTISAWLTETMESIQSTLNRICAKRGVNPAEADLRKVRPDAKLRTDGVKFNVANDIQDEIVTVVSALTAVIVSALSGGTGIALIASGPIGILAGAAIVLVPAFLLRRQARGAVKSVKISHFFRKRFITERKIFSDGSLDSMKKNCRKSLCSKQELTGSIREAISRYINLAVHNLEIQTKL